MHREAIEIVAEDAGGRARDVLVPAPVIVNARWLVVRGSVHRNAASLRCELRIVPAGPINHQAPSRRDFILSPASVNGAAKTVMPVEAAARTITRPVDPACAAAMLLVSSVAGA